MIVAIHQPNYLPWLGYFRKIARSDTFVFLDDVQFSKNSYTNRVKVLGPAGTRWLTLPVRVTLGQSIAEAAPATSDWSKRHLGILREYYRGARYFDDVLGFLNQTYRACDETSLAAVNGALVSAIARRLGLTTRFLPASSLDVASRSDRRLVDLCAALGATAYLSGQGGDTYQNPARFAAAGIELRHTDNAFPPYRQTCQQFHGGLSVVDALFHVGWDETARLIA